MFRKLNGLLLNMRFCSSKIFHWYIITDLIISKDFKVEADFSGEHDRNLLTLYETMYVQKELIEGLIQ